MNAVPQQNNVAGFDDFDFFAKEFASLLAASDFDKQTQEALINSLPHLKLEEIIDLVGILEAKYVVGKTTDLDNTLTERLESLTTRFLGAEQALDASVVEQLEAIAENLE